MVSNITDFKKPTQTTRDSLKKVTFGIGADLSNKAQGYLDQEKYNNKDYNFLNESFTLYYNSVILTYEGSTIVFPGQSENYDVRTASPRNSANGYHQMSIVLNKDSYEFLMILLTYTSAETIGDVIRSAIHFYVMYLEAEARGGEHRPYIHGLGNSSYLTEILEVLQELNFT